MAPSPVEKSIEVLPFNNQTLQPRLGDAVTQALRERLQTDATYHLATHGPGALYPNTISFPPFRSYHDVPYYLNVTMS